MLAYPYVYPLFLNLFYVSCVIRNKFIIIKVMDNF